MIETHAKYIRSLEDRPESHANRTVIWIALLIGVAVALGGDVISSVVLEWLF